MSKENGEFSYVVAIMNGKRVAKDPRPHDGRGLILHYGDVTDAEDPRWFCVSEDTLLEILHDIANLLHL